MLRIVLSDWITPQLSVTPRISNKICDQYLLYYIKAAAGALRRGFIFRMHASIDQLRVNSKFYLHWISHTINLVQHQNYSYNITLSAEEHRATSVRESLTCRTNRFSNRIFERKMPWLLNKISVVEQLC